MAGQKILIVDDEPFNVDYLEQELEGSDCEIFTAFNGQEAIDLVRLHSPDLILLDIMMPGMDGFTVLTALKADAATTDIPVIVISASSDMQSVVRGIKLGAEDYLPKPFDPTLLLARVFSSLEKKRLRDVEVLYLKSMEREFEIAREIQLSFLPSLLPEVAGWQVAARLKAAREVAGDFYDAFLLPDGNMVIVVGDVCGKGVGAALFMTLFRSLIRATATSDVSCSRKDMTALSPGERLQHVISFTNHYVAETHSDANMFATVVAGIVDINSGVLSYINCGNPPPMIIRGGRVVTSLAPTGPVIGVLDEARYEVKEIQLGIGDVLLAFTDGITDCKNSNDEFLGAEQIIKLAEIPTGTTDELLDGILEGLQRFCGEEDQFDDITMIAIMRTESR